MINDTIVPMDGPAIKKRYLSEDLFFEKFYQNFEKRKELFVLLLVPMLPKNEKLSAKDHPIINLQKNQIKLTDK